MKGITKYPFTFTGQTEAFLGGVFSAKMENVIFDPTSCNELGITQARKIKIYYFLRTYITMYYLKEFLNRTDLSPVTDKYDITIEQDELIETKNKDIYNIYFNGISMWTDRSLTDAEGSEVMEFVYNALDSFDTRDHFTKDPNCTSVSYALYCAPREEEAAVGTPHHMFSGRYGYRQ